MRNTILRICHALIVLVAFAFFCALLWALTLPGRVFAQETAHVVAEIPNVAKLTDQQGTCRREWFVARGPEFRRGCYRVEYPSYEVVIEWDDGATQRFTEGQFEVYGELRR